ncbi:MAG: DUF805 domain-containing protein [Actinobacteria bacterium]|nr:DUF805 domain-containing protein [Actinomycetota bacterium]
MTFAEAISTCLKKYADFKGRAARPEFWWFYLFAAIVNWGLMLTWISALSDPYNDSVPPGLILSFVVGLALLLPILAAGVRRMHDTGKSGAALFIALIPIVGTIILIVWLATEGTPGPNQYGDKPAR